MANTRNRRDVVEEVEIEIVVDRRVPGIDVGDDQQRLAIRLRLCDKFGCDIATRTWPVLDDELLTEPIRQPGTDQSCCDVGDSAGRKADDEVYGPGRIIERRCASRQDRKRGSAYCQIETSAAGKLHDDAPRLSTSQAQYQSYPTRASMSASGSKQTSWSRSSMSAFGGKADMSLVRGNVRF